MARFAEYRPGEGGGTPPADLRVRPATAADLAAVATLRAERDGTDLADARAATERLLARARTGDALLLVAGVADAVLGYGVAGRFDPPADAPPDGAPAGWYLLGLVVAPTHRRRGLGAALTARRLAWIAERAPVAWYFANARNLATIDLHARHGFREAARPVRFPGVEFVGGEGVLFRADLAPGS